LHYCNLSSVVSRSCACCNIVVKLSICLSFAVNCCCNVSKLFCSDAINAFVSTFTTVSSTVSALFTLVSEEDV
ncbi:MAG: hypothetical protein II453_08820, partial [Alphaproteobacteria bacterium]|nr:hypothetical protein [Alphaproteobacteria bacterium]